MSLSEVFEVDHVTFAVGDLRRATAWWSEHYGLGVFARSPEQPHSSGQRGSGVRSVAVGSGDIRLVLTEAEGTDSPVGAFTARHGDGVCDIALTTPDAASAFAEAVSRGASPVDGPRVRDDGVVTATIAGFGDVTHTFVQRSESSDSRALPGLNPLTEPPPDRPAVNTGLQTVDHIAVCVEAGQLASTVAYYEKSLDFCAVFTERILVGRQAMDSVAVQSRSGAVTLTILEPDVSRAPGQIDRFLANHGGAGVQHIAFATDDITRDVSELNAAGVEFLTTPGAYYDQLPDRLRLLRHSAERLRKLNILVDQDQDGQLLQIFARSVHPRGTLFFEIIERVGARSFGSGNIKALYEAVESQRDREVHDGASHAYGEVSR